jgi:hypothetical protein
LAFFRLPPLTTINSNGMMNGWRRIRGGSCALSVSKDRSRRVESNASDVLHEGPRPLEDVVVGWVGGARGPEEDGEPVVEFREGN